MPVATLWRLLLLLAVALVGLAIAWIFGLRGVENSSVYFYAASALLVIGLYGSTHGIDLAEARQNLRIVVIAVTLGVLAKAALVGLVMYLTFSSPAYLVFAVAVAQIDPLSTAAAMAGSRLSARGKSILAAWSAFDDPVTVLLTIYLSALALGLLGRSAEAGALAQDGLLTFGTNLVLNLVFAAVVIGLWLAVGRLRHRKVRIALQVVLVAGALFVAVYQFLMLGVALAGLVVRPSIDRALGKAVQVAFVVAAFGLGVVLAGGVDVWPGVVLGVSMFLAQALVGLSITWRLSRQDRAHLALAQQNGITAIILALLLEPAFPGAVAVVAPAILVINLLHGLTTGLWERYGEMKVPVTDPPTPTPVRPPVRGY